MCSGDTLQVTLIHAQICEDTRWLDGAVAFAEWLTLAVKRPQRRNHVTFIILHEGKGCVIISLCFCPIQCFVVIHRVSASSTAPVYNTMFCDVLCSALMLENTMEISRFDAFYRSEYQCGSVHHFDPDWNISTATGWCVKFGADIRFPLGVKGNHFDDPPTFPLLL